MAAPDSKITAIPNACPRCGGGIYDNTKGKGKSNPRSPDARCKDRDNCGWAGWLPEGANVAQRGKQRQQEYAWGPLLKLCVQYTKKEIGPLIEARDVAHLDEMVQKYAATLFITAKDGGHAFKLPAPVAPVPEAPATPPPAPQRQAAARGTGMDQDYYRQPPMNPGDDELPF